jgi:acylphosphatase
MVIEGRVQGVGYRWWTVETARRLGLAGWVRNCPDGSVEILAMGSDGAVAEFQMACLRGPPAAKVESVDVYNGEDDGSSGFDQRATH